MLSFQKESDVSALFFCYSNLISIQSKIVMKVWLATDLKQIEADLKVRMDPERNGNMIRYSQALR